MDEVGTITITNIVIKILMHSKVKQIAYAEASTYQSQYFVPNILDS